MLKIYDSDKFDYFFQKYKKYSIICDLLIIYRVKKETGLLLMLFNRQFEELFKTGYYKPWLVKLRKLSDVKIQKKIIIYHPGFGKILT